MPQERSTEVSLTLPLWLDRMPPSKMEYLDRDARSSLAFIDIHFGFVFCGFSSTNGTVLSGTTGRIRLGPDRTTQMNVRQFKPVVLHLERVTNHEMERGIHLWTA